MERSHIFNSPLSPLPLRSPQREDVEFHSYKSIIGDYRVLLRERLI